MNEKERQTILAAVAWVLVATALGLFARQPAETLAKEKPPEGITVGNLSTETCQFVQIRDDLYYDPATGTFRICATQYKP